MRIKSVFRLYGHRIEAGRKKSAKSYVEVSDVDKQNEIVTRERNLPRYLSDYTEVPDPNKLQTIKNRRKSMLANLTRKMNIIKKYLKERKDLIS